MTKIGLHIYDKTIQYFCWIRDKRLIFSTRTGVLGSDEKQVFENFIREKIKEN